MDTMIGRAGGGGGGVGATAATSEGGASGAFSEVMTAMGHALRLLSNRSTITRKFNEFQQTMGVVS